MKKYSFFYSVKILWQKIISFVISYRFSFSMVFLVISLSCNVFLFYQIQTSTTQSTTQQQETQQQAVSDAKGLITPQVIRSNFECFVLKTKKQNILQTKQEDSKVLLTIYQGQQMCVNFPQDISNSDFYITLKEFQQDWARVSLMSNQELLSGFIPLYALKSKDSSKQAKYLQREILQGGQKTDFIAPKIESIALPYVSGALNIENILNIATNHIKQRDFIQARSWLSLAQQTDSDELKTFILYAEVLLEENKIQEAKALITQLEKITNDTMLQSLQKRLNQNQSIESPVIQDMKDF